MRGRAEAALDAAVADRAIVAGAAASAGWLLLVVLFAWLAPGGDGGNGGSWLMRLSGVVMPLALIWLAVGFARAIAALRAEADALRARLDAIEAIAEIIVALRRAYWPVIAERTHPYFHPSSASVNLFSGGVKSNVVPDYAEIQIDRRLIPGEDPVEVVAEIRAVAALLSGASKIG